MTAPSTELARLVNARNAIEQARSLDELKTILDVAVAAKRYAQAKKLGAEAVAFAQEIVNRATRRMGELLAETPNEQGRRTDKLGSQAVPSPRQQAGKKVSSRSQKLADIPDDIFEANVAKPQSKVLKVAKDAETEAARAMADDTPLVTPTMDIKRCAVVDLVLDPDSVDLVFTDPPYPREFLSVWSDVAKMAAKALKPGGLLVAYTGQMFLPEVMARLGEHLDYWWTYSITHVGAFFQLQIRHVQVGWKPLLVYRKPGGELPPWANDIVTGGAREKSGHEWQQSEAEATYWIEKLTAPGDLVVDPFLGSGTTAAVAKKLGRRFIGCDVDPLAVARTKVRVE